MKIILKINKTNSDYYRSPYGVRISTAEADQTPGIVSPVGGRSRDRKVPSNHNAYTHTLMLDGRKFSKDSLHISLFCVSLSVLCSLNKDTFTCITYTKHTLMPHPIHQIHVMYIYETTHAVFWQLFDDNFMGGLAWQVGLHAHDHALWVWTHLGCIQNIYANISHSHKWGQHS